MAAHEIDPDALLYAPEMLDRKVDVGIDGFFAVDLRTGVVVDVESFAEARKPSYKLKVDFGPVIGVLQTSAHVSNYSIDELKGRVVVGAINLGSKRAPLSPSSIPSSSSAALPR